MICCRLSSTDSSIVFGTRLPSLISTVVIHPHSLPLSLRYPPHLSTSTRVFPGISGNISAFLQFFCSFDHGRSSEQKVLEVEMRYFPKGLPENSDAQISRKQTSCQVALIFERYSRAFLSKSASVDSGWDTFLRNSGLPVKFSPFHEFFHTQLLRQDAYILCKVCSHIPSLSIPLSSNGLVSPSALTCHLFPFLLLTRQSLAPANLLCSVVFTLLVIIPSSVRSLHLPCRNQFIFNGVWNTIIA